MKRKSVSLVSGFKAENAVVLAAKRDNLQVWAYTSKFNGRKYLHIREVYRTPEEEWAPSNKGLAIPSTAAPYAIKKLAAMKLLRGSPKAR